MLLWYPKVNAQYHYYSNMTYLKLDGLKLNFNLWVYARNSHLVISGLQCQLIIQAEFVPCNLCDLSTPLRFWISAYSNLTLSALLFNLILQSLYFNHNSFQVFLIFQLENQQYISILITVSDSWNFWCILTAFTCHLKPFQLSGFDLWISVNSKYIEIKFYIV